MSTNKPGQKMPQQKPYIPNQIYFPEPYIPDVPKQPELKDIPKPGTPEQPKQEDIPKPGTPEQPKQEDILKPSIPEQPELKDITKPGASEDIVIVLITSSDYGPISLPDHVAIWVESEKKPLLFDVAGGFQSSTRGSSPILSDPGALRGWLDYQKSAPDGVVEAFPFNISRSGSKEIVRRMEDYGTDPRGFECANAASHILSGVAIFKDIKQTNFPHRLRAQLVQIEKSLGR